MSGPLPWVEAVLDDRVQGIAERTSPWNKATTTFRVDLSRLGPAPRVLVVDTVGAGDAFAAGLGYGLLNSWTVPEILSVATRLGALVASRPGAIPAWDPADIGISA